MCVVEDLGELCDMNGFDISDDSFSELCGCHVCCQSSRKVWSFMTTSWMARGLLFWVLG